MEADEILTGLIDAADDVYKKGYFKDGPMLQIVRGPEYAAWIAKGTRFLQQYYPQDSQTKRFTEIGEKANGNTVHQYEALLGILKSFQSIPANPANSFDFLDTVIESICTNFHKCVKSLNDRHNNRGTLEIHDEYDVQDLLRSILKLFILDVRPEEYTPSYAGSSSRTDFFLLEYETFIEVKKTRQGLTDREVGNQLSEDILHYKSSCKKLICFIYDPEGRLKNPDGLKKDLENSQVEDLQVKVYIAP